MESYLPNHVCGLIRDLEVHKDTEQVLMYYKDFFLADPFLYSLYIDLNYNPHKGEFDQVPNPKKITAKLNSEFFGLQVPVKPVPVTCASVSKKPRNTNGLKTLSARVKSILLAKPLSSYQQTAEELVKEMSVLSKAEEKNIFRRVYDALNVLVAVGVVVKKGKEYEWRSALKSGRREEGFVRRLMDGGEVVVRDMEREEPEDCEKFQIAFGRGGGEKRIVVEMNRERSAVRLKVSKAVEVVYEPFLV